MVDEDAASRLRRVLELCEAGCLMRLQELRRAHPDEAEDELRQRLQGWLLRAEDADAIEPPLALRRSPPRWAEAVARARGAGEDPHLRRRPPRPL